MISIVAKFTINEGEEANFLTLINDLGKLSRAEEGCIEYLLHKDAKKPQTFCLIEKWENQETVDLHNNTAHFTNTVPEIMEIAKVEIDVYHPI